MRLTLTKVFSPILNFFENPNRNINSEDDFAYSPSHRKILAIMGVLFIIIAAVALYFSLLINQMAGLFPVVLFGSIGFVCLLVSSLGSDYAVAKLWRNRD